MADGARVDDLRRRVQRDPSSLAFAQLAEEYRRLGLWRDAVDTCREGLKFHPEYLSARVTLGRALLELGRVDDARRELEWVRQRAPEHLAAARALVDLNSRKNPAAVSSPRPAAAAPGQDRPIDNPMRLVAALEQWLAAIHVTRTQRLA
jgi:tetratricopeptide (TPR) repeat protein